MKYGILDTGRLRRIGRKIGRERERGRGKGASCYFIKQIESRSTMFWFPLYLEVCMEEERKRGEERREGERGMEGRGKE
jgi:hypothetical protein